LGSGKRKNSSVVGSLKNGLVSIVPLMFNPCICLECVPHGIPSQLA
jgi:hypothetical protein